MADETIVSLKEHIESRLASIQIATNIAVDNMDRRLGIVDATTYQHGKDIKDLTLAIKTLDIFQAVVEGKASQNSVWIAYAIGMIGIVIGVAGWFIGK